MKNICFIGSNFGFTQQLLVCKGETKTASCPGGSRISVVNALYGRVTSYECASGVDIYMSWFQYFATCVVPGAQEKVSALCSGKTSCELTASPVNFINTGGISCPETINYLRVTYTCSSKFFICHLRLSVCRLWNKLPAHRYIFITFLLLCHCYIILNELRACQR